MATVCNGGPHFYGQDREPSERLGPGRVSARPYSSTLARLPDPQSPLTGAMQTARTVAEAASSRAGQQRSIARPFASYGLICPEPRQAARHPMSARPEPPGPAGRFLPLPNAPGSASCPHETMRASCSFSYPRIPRCRGPHIGVPAWRQDSTLTPCVTGMPAAHRPFASAAGVSRNQGALPGAFQISQAPAGPPSIPCL